MSIGIFDSGIGGITLLKTLLKFIPKNHFIYLADLANMPYGDKTEKEIIYFTQKIIEFFFKKVNIIICACNTSCVIALEKMRAIYKNYNVLIIGVTDQITKIFGDNIVVLGTDLTIKTRFYETYIKKSNPNSNIISIACPELVPLIEKREIKQIEKVLVNYLKPITFIDTLVYACTHYPLIHEIIKKYFKNKQLNYFDPVNYLTNDLIDIIEEMDSITRLDFFVTKICSYFQENVESIIGFNIIKPTFINLYYNTQSNIQLKNN